MTLAFPTGEPFARGVTGYDYRPATAHETTPRLVLEVAIEGILAEAVVDTGGVYLVCRPDIARLYGCLERVRFAVDPRAEHFYFGPAAEDA